MAKTQEEVAFDMLSKLKGLGVWGEGNKDEILDLFAECLIAAKGQRRARKPCTSTATASRAGLPTSRPFDHDGTIRVKAREALSDAVNMLA